MDEEKIKKMQEDYKERKSQIKFNNHIENDTTKLNGLNIAINKENNEKVKISAAKIEEKQQNIAKSVIFYVVFCKIILKNIIIPFIKDIIPENYEFFVVFTFKIICLFAFIKIIKNIVDYIKVVKKEINEYTKKQNLTNVLNTEKSPSQSENKQINKDYIEIETPNKLYKDNDTIFNVEKKYCKKCGNALQIYTINGKKVEQCINPDCKKYKF